MTFVVKVSIMLVQIDFLSKSHDPSVCKHVLGTIEKIKFYMLLFMLRNNESFTSHKSKNNHRHRYITSLHFKFLCIYNNNKKQHDAFACSKMNNEKYKYFLIDCIFLALIHRPKFPIFE